MSLLDETPLDPVRVREILARATADLAPAERARVAELMAQRVRARNRGRRYPAPVDLARKLDDTTVQTPMLDLLDAELGRIADGTARRVAIFTPPQEGKSTRVTETGPLWLLLRNPDLRIGIASYELNVATRFGQRIRDEINARGMGTRREPNPPEVDVLSLGIREDYSAASRWRLADHRGGITSVGIGGALTGRPIDGLFIDDPVKDAVQAESIVYRERVWSWWTAVAQTRLPPGGFVVLIMTRWHEDDLGGRLIEQERMLPPEQRTWRFVSVPAVAEAPDPQGKRLPDALGRAPGTYLKSARGRTSGDFEATRLAVGERVWSALYQQNPTPPSGGIFTWASITRNRRPTHELDADGNPGRDLLPGIIDSLTVRRVAVDPPGGSGSRDEAGIVGGGRAGDRIYVTHDRSGQLTATQWPRRALLLAFELGADTIVWEQNLAPGTTRTVIAQAWVRLQRQARVVTRHLEATDNLEQALEAAALELVAAETGLAPELVDDTSAQLDEIRELLPWRRSIADYIDSGPRLKPVTATQGKRVRATPIAVAYEQNRVSHVGVFPELETQLTTWVEGEPSPDRMDADVWLITELLPPPRRSRREPPPATTIPTGADSFRR